MKSIFIYVFLAGLAVTQLAHMAWASPCDRFLHNRGIAPYLKSGDYIEDGEGFYSVTNNSFAWAPDGGVVEASYYTESAAHLDILRRQMGVSRLNELLASENRGQAIQAEVLRMRQAVRTLTSEAQTREEGRLRREVAGLGDSPLPPKLFEDILLHLERVGLYAPSLEEYILRHGLEQMEAADQVEIKWLRVYILNPGQEQTELILFSHGNLPLVQPLFMHEDLVFPLLDILSTRRLDFRLAKRQADSLLGIVRVCKDKESGDHIYRYFDHHYQLTQTSDRALPIGTVAPRANEPLAIDLSVFGD